MIAIWIPYSGLYYIVLVEGVSMPLMLNTVAGGLCRLSADVPTIETL